MSYRRIKIEDYKLLEHVLTRTLAKSKRRSKKQWLNLVSMPSVMANLYNFENAYIVDDSFLVVYDLSPPWYNNNVVILEEVIVARLVPGAPFSSVTSFLEARREEAGAKLVMAGTALAPSDDALASLYEQNGFQREAILMVKEIT